MSPLGTVRIVRDEDTGIIRSVDVLTGGRIVAQLPCTEVKRLDTCDGGLGRVSLVLLGPHVEEATA